MFLSALIIFRHVTWVLYNPRHARSFSVNVLGMSLLLFAIVALNLAFVANGESCPSFQEDVCERYCSSTYVGPYQTSGCNVDDDTNRMSCNCRSDGMPHLGLPFPCGGWKQRFCEKLCYFFDRNANAECWTDGGNPPYKAFLSCSCIQSEGIGLLESLGPKLTTA